MITILNFIKEYSVPIAIVVSLFGGLFKFWQYIDVKRTELKQKRFENYHKLIERLTAPLSGHEDTYIDVQKATVFELRNYPEYTDVTKDIFNGWIERKSKLSDVMEKTLEVLNK